MRNPRRTPPVAAMLLFVLLVAGCAAPAGDLASVEDAAGREIARIGAGVPGGRGPAGGEPAGGTLEDGGGNAAGRAGPDASPAPDAPVPYRPIGSGSGGASGGGASGMEPGAIDPAVPVEGAGSSGFAGEASDLLLLYCGEDEDVLGRGRNLNARRCLWDAYLANRAAAFRTVAYTTEGDPIAYHLDVLGRDRIQVLVDSEDRFGATGEFLYTCTAMEFTDDFGFVLQGCTPNEPEGNRAFVTDQGELYVP